MKEIEVTVNETYYKTVKVQVEDNYTDADIKAAYNNSHLYIDDLLSCLNDYAGPSEDFIRKEAKGWHCAESVIVEG